MRRAATLVSLLSLVVVNTSVAQGRFYLDGAFGATRISSSITRPDEAQPTVSAIAAGYMSARGFGIEIRRSGLQAETTTPSKMEPYTVGMRAAVIEANLTYRPVHARLGRFTPAVSVGVAQAAVTDYWISDTPREESQLHARGLTGAAMIDFRIVRQVSLIARVGVQRLAANRARIGAAFDLIATTVGAGLRLWL
jgi:hypothetical protein